MKSMNLFNNKALINNDNLEEKTRLSHFSPVLLKKKGTKLVFLYKGQRYAVDSESEESRENCKETLNSLDSEHIFNWFKEETGNKQVVDLAKAIQDRQTYDSLVAKSPMGLVQPSQILIGF